MSISLYPVLHPIEITLSTFMDRVILEQGNWKTKTDLIHLWNAGANHSSVTSRIIIKEIERPKKEEKQVEIITKSPLLKPHSSPSLKPVTTSIPPLVLSTVKEDTDQDGETVTEVKSGEESGTCIFRITRGNKEGEICGTRSKKGSYCIKHFKEPKDKKIITKENVVPDVVVEVPVAKTSSSSVEFKLKKKNVKQETSTVDTIDE